MASILIRQFAGQSVPPTSDAILYENATTGNGVIHGCNCTASDASTIHIDAGYGVIQGRFFEIEDQTISVTLAPSGTLLGQLYIHLDLSDADTPIDIYHEEAASLTAMTQQSGINYSNGIYEIQLCTYDVSTSTISNVTDTFPTLVTTATLNSRTTWKTIATGVTTLTHDFTQYQELLVDVAIAGVVNHATIHLITASLNSSSKNYLTGFYRSNSDCVGVRVIIKNNGITGCAVYADGNTSPISSTFTVYAR